MYFLDCLPIIGVRLCYAKPLKPKPQAILSGLFDDANV
jgi:hypothetical protein